MFNFFKKKPSSTKDDTYLDVIVSLNKNKQIDFSIFINDNSKEIDMNNLDYALLCGEFLSAILSKQMKNDAISILNDQIKNKNNQDLIDNIVSIIKIIDVPQQKTPPPSQAQFIKPSEVFIKYV